MTYNIIQPPTSAEFKEVPLNIEKNNEDKLKNDTSLIANKYTQDTFIYKSMDMVNFMSPGGVWSSEIIDNRHIVFRRAQDAVDIRPGKKLNILMCGLLFMNIFYDEFLSYILMFAIWSSIVCMCTPDPNGSYSWNSLAPQLLCMASYGKTGCMEFADTFALYVLLLSERYDDYLCYICDDISMDEEEDGLTDDDLTDDDLTDDDLTDDDLTDDDLTEDGLTDDDLTDDDNNSTDDDGDDSDNNSSVTDCSSKTHASMPELINEEEEQTQNNCISFYDNLYNIHCTNAHFINWVKSVENDLFTEDYKANSSSICNQYSDEQWIFDLACNCVAQSITLDEVWCKLEVYRNRFTVESNTVLFSDFAHNHDDDIEDADDDVVVDESDWDTGINSLEFIRPQRDGMWLRSAR
jgi:hypothetical protein